MGISIQIRNLIQVVKMRPDCFSGIRMGKQQVGAGLNPDSFPGIGIVGAFTEKLHVSGFFHVGFNEVTLIIVISVHRAAN